MYCNHLQPCSRQMRGSCDQTVDIINPRLSEYLSISVGQCNILSVRALTCVRWCVCVRYEHSWYHRATYHPGRDWAHTPGSQTSLLSAGSWTWEREREREVTPFHHSTESPSCINNVMVKLCSKAKQCSGCVVVQWFSNWENTCCFICSVKYGNQKEKEKREKINKLVAFLQHL